MDAAGQPALIDELLRAAHAHGVGFVRDVLAEAELAPESAAETLAACIRSGALIPLEAPDPAPDSQNLIITAPDYIALKEQILATLASYHQLHPMRRGLSREALRSQLKLMPRAFQALVARLAQDGALKVAGKGLALPQHTVRFLPHQQVKVDALMEQFEAAPFAPPSLRDCRAVVGDTLLAALLESGDLVQVAPEVAFRRADYEKMVARLREVIEADGALTAAQVRDLFGTSRKYALAFLEHLDAVGVTVRDGDVRRLRR